MLCRHEINYWFSDALMGLKVVLHLVHNVSIAITSALSVTSTLFFFVLLFLSIKYLEYSPSFKSRALLIERHFPKAHFFYYPCFIPSAEVAV